jgi:2'-5' RNA ligase
MRCFIAVDLPEEVKKDLGKIQGEIPKEGKILLVNQQILHLTLRFLGEMDDSQADKIKGALKTLKINKFKARLSGIGMFPSEAFIRVVWAGLEPAEKFREIHEMIDKELDKIQISKDERFESHVTLARVKFVKDKKDFTEKIKQIKIQPIEFNVEKISFKKSTLTEKGPVYKDLAEIKLA